MPKSKKEGTINTTDMGACALSYFSLDKQVKDLSKEKDKFKTVLVDYVNGYFDADHPNSSYGVEVTYADKIAELRMTARTTTEPKPEFAALIKKHPNLRKYTEQLVATETVTYLDMKVLEQLIKDGKVTEEEAKQIVELKTNFAFTPKLIK